MTSIHILVVDDEPAIRRTLRANLAARGYDAIAVETGEEALRLAGARMPDLVILDLMLPGMSGYAVCQSLRREGNDVPVLMLSARTLPEDRIQGYDVGANQYLQKPFELDELLAMVRNLLGRSRVQAPRASETFQFGRAKVNFDTYEATVGDQEIQLSPLEMNLLRYFIDNEGRVISRTELVERVWRQPYIETTRTVDNFVMRLRKYFERDPSDPQHFLSVRGVGYRFVSGGEDV